MEMLVYGPLDVGYCFTLAEIGLHPQSVCAQGPQHLYNQLCCIISKGHQRRNHIQQKWIEYKPCGGK